LVQGSKKIYHHLHPEDQNPSSQSSRPKAANDLAQQLKPGKAENRNGFFARFAKRSTPDPYNPGCAGGPKSITVKEGIVSRISEDPGLVRAA